MKVFNARRLALKAQSKYMGCDNIEDFCLACVEKALRVAYEMGRKA